jgi:hypothetical protein
VPFQLILPGCYTAASAAVAPDVAVYDSRTGLADVICPRLSRNGTSQMGYGEGREGLPQRRPDESAPMPTSGMYAPLGDNLPAFLVQFKPRRANRAVNCDFPDGRCWFYVCWGWLVFGV